MLAQSSENTYDVDLDDSEQGLIGNRKVQWKAFRPGAFFAICLVTMIAGVCWARKAVSQTSQSAESMATVSFAADSLPQYDTAWQALISGSDCPDAFHLKSKNGATGGGKISCQTTDDGGRHFRFPAGEFDIDQQVVIPAGTILEGNANPNNPSNKAEKPPAIKQTIFMATRGISDPGTLYCGNNNNIPQGQAQKLRIGFLLNSNTIVKHINYQGKDTVRPHDNGYLCGGGAFETPGCVSSGFSNGVGNGHEGQRYGCFDSKGNGNGLITGDGKGVNNVLIDSVRVNDYLRVVGGEGDYGKAGKASQVAVWVAMTQDGSSTQITIRNLVSMLTRGDGINLHGNVQNSIVEDCHVENTGDDIYAFWGSYAENPVGNVFRNNVAVNPGMTRWYKYGVCVAIYGAKELTVTGNKCYDTRDFGQGCCQPDHCNSCLAMVHGGWFGAVYPQGNKINITGNAYYYMDKPAEHIPQSSRPMVKKSRADAANVIGWN
mmetsp:Transcript_24904/g.50504  ORF Transcript_24904/g.50504 Transcript_24904/m.50504 type:complete len:489 (-) Transcript_24904:269-1735(-)